MSLGLIPSTVNVGSSPGSPSSGEVAEGPACAAVPSTSVPMAGSGYGQKTIAPQPPLTVAMVDAPASGSAAWNPPVAGSAAAGTAGSEPDNDEPSYTNCPSDVNRSAEIFSQTSKMSFPAPASYDDLEDVELDASAMLLSRGPWMYTNTVADVKTVSAYVQNWRVPGHVPVEALYSRLWRNSLAAEDEHLRVGRRGSVAIARRNYTRWVYRLIRRFSGQLLYPICWDLDCWAARYPSEFHFARRVSEISSAQVEGWKGVFDVTNEALLFTRSLLPLEFRYLRKRELRSFNEFARLERRNRSRFGYLLPYQHTEFALLTDRARESRFVPIDRYWRQLEVPRGCYAELPSVLTLLQGDLWYSSWNGTTSGWWVLFYTEWAARVAAYVLWDAYDNFRLWCLSSTLIEFIRRLNLSQVLGSSANAAELLDYLTEIEGTDWTTVPVEWTHRPASSSATDLSPGRVGEGGDFFYFDPVTRERISAERARERHQDTRVIPDGHPRGHPEIAANSLGWAPPGTSQQGDARSSERHQSPEPVVDGSESEGSPRFPGTPVPGTPVRGTPRRERTPVRSPRPQPSDRRRSSPSGAFGLAPSQAAMRANAGGAGYSAARAAPAAGSSAAHAAVGADRLGVIKQFLVSAGFSEDELEGDEAEVRGYVRALKRQRRF